MAWAFYGGEGAEYALSIHTTKRAASRLYAKGNKFRQFERAIHLLALLRGIGTFVPE